MIHTLKLRAHPYWIGWARLQVLLRKTQTSQIVELILELLHDITYVRHPQESQAAVPAKRSRDGRPRRAAAAASARRASDAAPLDALAAAGAATSAAASTLLRLRASYIELLMQCLERAGT